MKRFWTTACALLATTGATESLAAPAPEPGTPAAEPQRGHPLENPGTWFRDKDYPLDAKRAGAQGRVSIRVGIDAKGRITDCTILTSSGNASLDAVTCASVRARGRFSVQKGADGKPEPYSYTIPGVRWSLLAPPPTVPPGAGPVAVPAPPPVPAPPAG